MPKTIVCVAGPTASGKTKLGVLLAGRYDGEIVSADSMQIYRGMVIGTAAPTPEEMEGIPHHMIGVADPREKWSAALYGQRASAVVDDILSRGRIPILVGGTGLWLDAVVKGHGFAGGFAGGEVRAELQRQLEQEGVEPLLEELRRVDPERADRLHGLQFADREDQRRLIDRRVDEMVRQGLLAEVRALLGSGLPRDATALQAIGYKEFLGVLNGTCTEEEAIAEVKLRSRQYAKRQLTWLRKIPGIHWITWDHQRDFVRALQISTEILSAEGLG